MTPAGNYPIQYESWLTLKNGKEIFVRPILPSDRNLVLDFFQKLSPQSVYMRFLKQIRVLPKDILYRFTHIYYPREFALVGIIKENGQDAIVAVARYAYSSYYDNTDLAITVRDDWQNMGIGKALLKKVVDVGKENGIFRFIGIVHPDNQTITRIAADLGYKQNYSLKNGIYEIEIII